MRRNARLKKHQSKTLSDKIILYCGIGVVFLTVIVFALLMYSKSLNEDVKNSTMTLEQMANIAGNNTSNTQSASTQIGKSVEESEKENNTNTQNITSNTNSTNTNSNTTNTTGNNVITTNSIRTAKQNTPTNTTNTNSTKQETTEKTEPKKELSFVKPVEGDIVREFAKDNLIYSETLKEWITHTAIDIKADKTSVIKSAAAGIVKSIVNDPRYGLTVVIEHDDGYETVYSNLLTAEFVVEGEEIEQGQTIGTAGNTAAFESSIESHLHFELLKDGEYLDPTIYLK